MNKFVKICRAAILATAIIGFLCPKSEAQDTAGASPGAQDRPSSPFSSREPEIKSYDKVITKDAQSDEGLFTVHRIKDKVYYEIPKDQLNKELLWVSQIAKTTLGVGYGGQALGNRVVKWERRNNRVLLRSVSYDIAADPNLPISRAVQASNNDTILMSFYIEAFGKDEAPVIDV
jgi:hypothetical protein